MDANWENGAEGRCEPDREALFGLLAGEHDERDVNSHPAVMRFPDEPDY
ncbi:hypothetical protein [Mycolicibacterium bacteremicum]|nr:hypothetical protein [Mycolicibacterium bacteremicum]MCV7431653.1 hypothetical protein [Mycolicibacterium bacteremicum]